MMFMMMPMKRFAVSALFACLSPWMAHAASYFVEDTIAENGVAKQDAQAATLLVKNAVAARASDTLVTDDYRADYVLQPRLLQLGDSMILTVEKARGQETVFAAQTKVASIDQLDRAARSATFAAIDEPTLPKAPRRSIASEEARPAVPYQVAPVIVTPGYEVRSADPAPTVGRTTGRNVELFPRERKVNYWTIGGGPFVGRRLETDEFMYNFALGHTWDINPRASVKALGEAAFSSGQDPARFFNLGAGASYFFPTRDEDNAPYVTADIGYGFAEDRTRDEAEGFSFGTGVGFQFFRTTETTLDLLLRYVVVFDQIDRTDSNPSIIGARLAVNF